jgi:glycosyltransferase involved in cell wall biosynthesis
MVEMNPIPITHYFTFFDSLGGVQSLLRRHIEKDAAFGLDSNIEAFFDPASSEAGRVQGLGLSWRSTVRSARRAFARRTPGIRRPFAVYNNFWGLPFFADLDGADRRIAVLHSYAPVLRDCLDAEDGLVDGVLCVSRPLMEVVYRHLPSLERSRVILLPLPIASCPFPVRHAPLAGRPLRLGLAGRLQKEQKRVDRLPELVAALDAARLDYRLELLGAGASEGWLRRQFAENPRVALLGHRTGADYWKALSEWDVILFTSDYEGLPLSMLEAMSVGVLPVYPRIESGGDGYARDMGAEFFHEPGDFQAVARSLSQLAAASEERWSSWRAHAHQLVLPHLGDSYHEVFSDFVRKIASAPRVSASSFSPRRFYWSDHCPFGLMVRTWLRGFYRRNDR